MELSFISCDSRSEGNSGTRHELTPELTLHKRLLMNFPPRVAEPQIQSSSSEATNMQSDSNTSAQSENTTAVGCTGVGESLTVEKHACVAADSSEVEGTPFEFDVMSTQGQAGTRPSQQRQDVQASVLTKLQEGSDEAIAAAQLQTTTPSSVSPPVRSILSPEEMRLRTRIEFAREAVLRLAGVNPLAQSQRDGQFVKGLMYLIERQSRKEHEARRQCSLGHQSSSQLAKGAAQRALEVIQESRLHLRDLSGIEELRALESIALRLASIDPNQQLYLKDGTLAKGLERILEKRQRTEDGGAIEIAEMRKLLLSFSQWDAILGVQSTPECREAQKQLEAIRSALSQSEPATRALEMFKYAHRLSASCERRSPANAVLPVGLAFVETDMDDLALLRKELLRVLKFNKKKIEEIERAVNSVNNEQQQLSTGGKLDAQAICLMDVHRTLKDGSHSAELTFDTRLARISRFLTPVLFWGEFLRSTRSEGWGDRQEDARHSLDNSRTFQVTVLAGGHSESGLDEPESWWGWGMRMAEAAGLSARY